MSFKRSVEIVSIGLDIKPFCPKWIFEWASVTYGGSHPASTKRFFVEALGTRILDNPIYLSEGPIRAEIGRI